MSYKVCLALSLPLLKVLQNGGAEWTQSWTTLFCIKSLLIPVTDAYQYYNENSLITVSVKNYSCHCASAQPLLFVSHWSVW